MAADAPIAALRLFDDHDRVVSKAFAFDGDHRIRDLFDQLLLFGFSKNTFDHFDIRQGHLKSPFTKKLAEQVRQRWEK